MTRSRQAQSMEVLKAIMTSGIMNIINFAAQCWSSNCAISTGTGCYYDGTETASYLLNLSNLHLLLVLDILLPGGSQESTALASANDPGNLKWLFYSICSWIEYGDGRRTIRAPRAG